MLVRAYRLSDKLGLVAAKLAVLLADHLLDGITLLWRALWMLLLLILRPVLWVINALLRVTTRGAVQVGTQSRQAAVRAADDAMARRAARAEMAAAVVEDPLKRQNRVLSAMTVVLLVALIGIILYATNPARAALPVNGFGAQGGSALVDSIGQAGTPTAGVNAAVAQPTAASVISNPLLATVVPTASPLPAVLQVGGSLAYAAREDGQTDIWVAPVGGRAPLRLTNSPEDDRDPAWSPNGRQIAYASRRNSAWDLYIRDLATGADTRITVDLNFQGAPTWSPDGTLLAYESYQGENLDIYLVRVDNAEPPIRLPGNSDAPDFQPAWSPDGRRIAFVSLRDGRQDIYLFSLDDQSVVNLTNTPERDEDYPAWSPDEGGDLLAYSALDAGAEKVFVQSTNDLSSPPQVISFGRTPNWSPDGTSLVFMADSSGGTQLTAYPYSGQVVGTPIVPVPLGATNPVWTRTALPAAFVSSGGLPPGVTGPLYIEQENRRPTDPPYALQPLPGVTAETAALSDRVNDSFNAMREAAQEQIGYDLLGRLDDVFWSLERPPEPGEERRNWLMTGRAFAITRNSITGFPPPLEIVREDVGVSTSWRVFVRADDDLQSGELGEPLRRIPWDFASRTAGDVQAYDQGGRLRDFVPGGYYIDLTELAGDYGWSRAPAGQDWRANANSINYWLFRKPDGLTWYDAMLEIYPAGQLINFAPTLPPVVATALPDGGSAPGGVLPTATPPVMEFVPTLTNTPPNGGGGGGDSAPVDPVQSLTPDAP